MHLYLVTHFLSLDDSINLSKYDGPAFGCAILVVVVFVIAVVILVVGPQSLFYRNYVVA